MNDGFKPTGHRNTNTRASFFKLRQPSPRTSYGQKTRSYVAPTNIWNSLPLENLKTYKQKVRQHFLDTMKNGERSISE